MPPLRYAVIGAWGHLGIPLGEIGKYPGSQAVGLAPGVDADDMQRLRERTPCLAAAQIYPDYREMLAAERPDLVIISTHLYRITEIAINVARARCHMICEKPLAIDLSALDDLEKAVRDSGVHCVPMLHNRMQPVMASALEVVKAGSIGEVVIINARKSYKWGTRPEWFGDRKLYGGTIPWIGIHALDFIDLLSSSPWTAVAAMHSNKVHLEREHCEDNCVLILSMKNGGHCTASIDFLRPESAPTHGDDWVRVVGSKGVLEAYLERGKCWYIPSGGEKCDVTPKPPTGTYTALFDSLASGQPLDRGETQRGFMLTRASLIARDAADQRLILPLPDPSAR